jgi:hypothetical protein
METGYYKGSGNTSLDDKLKWFDDPYSTELVHITRSVFVQAFCAVILISRRREDVVMDPYTLLQLKFIHDANIGMVVMITLRLALTL